MNWIWNSVKSHICQQTRWRGTTKMRWIVIAPDLKLIATVRRLPPNLKTHANKSSVRVLLFFAPKSVLLLLLFHTIRGAFNSSYCFFLYFLAFGWPVVANALASLCMKTASLLAAIETRTLENVNRHRVRTANAMRKLQRVYFIV